MTLLAHTTRDYRATPSLRANDSQDNYSYWKTLILYPFLGKYFNLGNQITNCCATVR